MKMALAESKAEFESATQAKRDRYHRCDAVLFIPKCLGTLGSTLY